MREHIFESDEVNSGRGPAGAALQVAETDARTAPAGDRLLPVLPELVPLLGASGVRRGATVAVTGSTSLALALVAGASAAGSWVAAVNLPDLGVVAAAELGVALGRLALVPRAPRERWAAAVAALLDGMDVVLTAPPPGVRADHARRLSARARERRTLLVLTSTRPAWPDGADLRLTVEDSRWHGLGQGHGRLTVREVGITATGRGSYAQPRHARLLLPGAGGGVAAPEAADPPPDREDGPPYRPAAVSEVPPWNPSRPPEPSQRFGRQGRSPNPQAITRPPSRSPNPQVVTPADGPKGGPEDGHAADPSLPVPLASRGARDA